MSDLVDLQIHNPKPIKWIHTLTGVLSLLIGGKNLFHSLPKTILNNTVR